MNASVVEKTTGSNRLVEVVVETGKLPKLMVPPDARAKVEPTAISWNVFGPLTRHAMAG